MKKPQSGIMGLSVVAALFLALAGTLPLAAQEIPSASSVMPPGYLQAMPMVDRVLADMKVADSVETRARQYAAVSYLDEILYVLTRDHFYVPGGSGLTPKEDSLNRGYEDAQGRLFRLSGKVPGLLDLINRYSAESSPFRRELLDRYFSPAWKTAFLTLKAQSDERERALETANAAPRAEAPAPPVPTAIGAQAARRGPPAFDTALVRLRPQYHGDDLAAIYRAYGEPKGELETTAQFQRRVANAPSPRPFAFLMDISSVPAGSLTRLGDDLTMQYNADAAELTVHLQVECQGHSGGENTAKLIARSSFASNYSRVIGFPDYSMLVSCPEGEIDISYPVHLEPGAARRAQGHIGAVLVGVPALLPGGGYTRLEHGGDLHELHITPLSLWMVNTSTGEVLNKHPFAKVRQ